MDILSGLANFLLVGAAFCNAVIGGLVLSRNAHLKLNRYFFLLSLAISGWATTNVLFQLVNDSLRYPIALLSYSFAALLGVAFLLFAHTLTGLKVFGYKVLIGIGLCTVPLVLIPDVLADSVVNGVIQTNPGPFALFAFVLVLLIGTSIGLLVSAFRKARDTERARLRIIVIGLIVAALVGLVCNLLLPLSHNYSLVAIGPSGSLVFVAVTAYAIVRHRLFDIKLVAVRVLAYVVTLVVIAGIFGITVFGVSQVVFDFHLNIWAQIYISVATAIAALAFGSLKSFFDRVTNQLFYQDAYDSQVVLDRLNRSLVSNTDMERLLSKSATIIAETFRPEFCYFDIREHQQMPRRVIGVGVRNGVARLPVANMHHMTASLRQKIVVGDELEAGQAELRTLLQQNGVAVLGQLTPSLGRGDVGLGYLVIGSRRSGNPYTGKDIRTLEIIVNSLVLAVENSLRFEQIQHFNETLQENVGEATRKLRKTNEKLQGLDATKDEFITMASHQLRTPLTAVKGYLSMVLEGDAGKLNANQRRLLEQSYVSAQRMVYLIADLLNLSRLGTGKFVIEPTPTNLVDVVQSELNQLAQTAASRDVHLAFNYPEDFPELMLDETKIHQVVMNFIDNAIYYTPPGGKVTVNLVETPGSVQYIVQDTGIGVPRKEQRHLFTKFYRAENARQARPDGTGLGLFMAKKVVAAQGGAIIFESEEGKGSSFGFRFNKRTHAVPSAKEQVVSSK